MSKQSDDQYTTEEARQRFEAGLRGARIADPTHKESVTPTRGKPQQKKKSKKALAAG
jgi:hypothetical protein